MATTVLSSQPRTARDGGSGSRRRRLRLITRSVPLAIVAFLVVFGPSLAAYDPELVSGPTSAAPSGEHWFGTDSNGFDVYSRTLAAFRIDVVIGLTVTAIATLLGVVLGLFAGMHENRDRVWGALGRGVGRVIDVLQALPILIAGLVLVSFFGRNALVISLALGVILTPFQARITRTEVARVRGAGYIDAARVSGMSETRLLFVHVLPNSVRPVIENTSAIFAMGIVLSAALGFLGVGIPLPTPEWGSMLSLGASDAAVGRWWPALFPSLALAFTVWAAAVFVSSFTDRRT